MKKAMIGLSAVLMLAVMVGVAAATSFTNTVDFNDNGTGFKQITEATPFAYTHTLSIGGSAYALDSATLQLRQTDNRDNNNEVWFSYAGGSPDIPIGKLSKSQSGWVIDSWVLDSTVRGLMDDSNPWSLTVKLRESTDTDNNSLKIDYSTLSGEYTSAGGTGGSSVPVPAPLVLLGSGLVGLVTARRKK